MTLAHQYTEENLGWGDAALYSLRRGSRNIAIGPGALADMSDGSDWVGIVVNGVEVKFQHANDETYRALRAAIVKAFEWSIGAAPRHERPLCGWPDCTNRDAHPHNGLHYPPTPDWRF